MKRPYKLNHKYIRGFEHSPSIDYEDYADDLDKYIDYLETKLIQ